MKLDKKQITVMAGTVGIALAIIGAAGYAFGYLSLELYVALLGIGGFAGLAGLRMEIESSGYKTLIISAGGALVSLGVGTGVVQPEIATVLMSVLGVGALPTLGHAVKKMNGK